MPEELIDNQQRETLTVAGTAPNVLDADRQAWSLLETVLDRDPVEAWTMTEMKHTITAPGQLEWAAKYQRDPDYGIKPLTVREVSDEEFAAALADDKAARAAAGRGPRS
jgi:hypothetical protein